MQVSLTAPQFDFVAAEEQFPAFVGGFGSGKTHAGIWRALTRKLAYPKQNVAYYLPTYDLVSRMAFPRFEETLELARLPFKINKNEAVIDVENRGSVIFRTMDNPARIVAYEVADSIADELDTLAVDKAREVWNKIIARNRQKKPDGSLNTVGVATTPEGFRFVYERWRKSPAPGYRLIRAATMSNAANLPDGYIDSLRTSYPANLLQAYLDGEFVNLTAGSVYAEFDRELNKTPLGEGIRTSEPLHIGMDFNVGKMSAVIFVLRDGDPRAVGELTGLLDTPAMIAAIKSRYVGHAIYVYPDSSGGNRKSVNASESDIALLRQAKFNVLAPSANPPVKDRVMAMNQMIHSEGKRRLLVNADACPSFVEGLEKQAYDKNGEPDKTAGFDHANDAAGYFIHYKFPVLSRTAGRRVIGGI
ncbi:MAG TPA: terminase family protein [Novosphingobium sp.]|nr:terminase family protein [Novosphingobium sp.]